MLTQVMHLNHIQLSKWVKQELLLLVKHSYTTIANPQRFIPDWTFGIYDDTMQELVDKIRTEENQMLLLFYLIMVLIQIKNG